jgi:hypothetical protein
VGNGQIEDDPGTVPGDEDEGRWRELTEKRRRRWRRRRKMRLDSLSGERREPHNPEEEDE